MRNIILAFAASASAIGLTGPSFALGDSITFGETYLRYIRSDGVRGYVDDFAAILAERAGGVAPDVINLAIDGETSASFFFTGFGRTTPVVGRGDLPLALQNVNYPGPILLSQSEAFLQHAAGVAAAGDTIDTVSITLDFNELAALSLLPAEEGLAAIASTLESYRITYGEVLSQIRSVAPNADLYVLNYFNPFPGDDNPTPNPAAPIFAAGGAQLNAIIAELAAEYDGIYVDTFTPFVGREQELTFIDEVGNGDTTPPPYSEFDQGLAPIGNVHRNQLGYAVIAAQLAAASLAAVPEPASWAMMIAGFGAVGAAMRRGRIERPRRA